MKSPLKLTINSIIQTRYGTTKLWTFHTPPPPPKKQKNLTSTLTSVLRLLKKKKERNLDISDNK